MTKHKRNKFIRNLVLGYILVDIENMKLSQLQKEIFPLLFLEFRCIFFLFCSFRNIAIKFYMKIFLEIIIISICRTLRLSISTPFNILKFSSNKKLEKEKLNKKSSLFKEFLELYLLLGFL